MHGPIKVVSPGFDRDVDGRTAGHALLGVHRISDDVHRFHRIHWWDISDDVRQPGIGNGSAVQPRIVVRVRRSVDIGAERPLRVACVRVQLGRRREAGNDLMERLPVAAGTPCERQVRNLSLLDQDVHVGTVGLQRDGGSGDGDRLAHLRYFQLDIHAPHGIGGNGDVFLDQGAERRQGVRHAVKPGLEIVECVASGVVGAGSACDAGARIERLHADVRYSRARWIADIAREGAV